MFKYKDLLSELIKREIKAKYKQSILGYAWVLLVPLINLVIMTVVFSFFIRVSTGDIPYPIYLFTGMVPWLFTLNAVSSATSSVVQNYALITKVSLPRYIFPIASVSSKVIDFSLNFIIMLVLMLFFKAPFYWTLIWVPLIFVVQYFLVLGISLILSSINVYFRDVENVIGVILTMWMYLTPVFYPPELVPEGIKPFFNLNPITPLINSYRNTILYGVVPPWQSFAYSIAVSLLIFTLGFFIFRRLSKNFADII